MVRTGLAARETDRPTKTVVRRFVLMEISILDDQESGDDDGLAKGMNV